jgi:succinate dehydrogenase / fumarate reductase flavoprotein subunit
VVIVGAGGSGMRASLQLARAGLNVAVLSKVFPTRSHTVAAQGGVSASLGNMSEDNWEFHFYDTVKGSDWLGDQDAIEFMCREAPKVVYDLEHMGMPFDRNPDGTIYQRPFGGHTANYGEKPVQRACAAADRTGHAMLHTLYQANVSARTTFFVEWMALDLIRDASGDVRRRDRTGNGNRRPVRPRSQRPFCWPPGAPAGSMQASTNAFINTGDGLGMAARAGIALQDMEFWQFHPTGVAGAGVLLTEGCRGEGAILLNSNGERFMERYAPTLKDLAPRDFVSRCMGQEILEGRGCGPNKDYIHMKLDHLGADTIHKRLPSVYEIGVNFANVDITREPIPVVPTIHYQMGGIPDQHQWPGGETVNGRGPTDQRPVCGGRMLLRVGARCQPPGHQLAAGPAGFRQGRWKPHRCQRQPQAGTQAPARQMPPTHPGTSEPPGQLPGWRVRAGRGQRHARHHADARRRVPQPGIHG